MCAEKRGGHGRFGQAAAGTGTATGVILLVEDRADDVHLTTWAFRRSGITNEIVVARDGVEALELLLPDDGRVALRPMIVLLDINMPRMGGLELLRRLRWDASTRSLPVVVLTTSDEEREIARCHDFGANGCVQKPVTADGFLEAAGMLGIHWLDLKPADPTRSRAGGGR